MRNPSAAPLPGTTLTVAFFAATGSIPVTCRMSSFHMANAVVTTGSTSAGTLYVMGCRPSNHTTFPCWRATTLSANNKANNIVKSFFIRFI